MEVYLVRHTPIDVESGICYGQSNIDVTDSFPEDAKQVKRRLPSNRNQAVFYSSPLLRCRKLAEFLSDGSIYYDDRLKELDFGDWELQKWEDLPADQVEKWSRDQSIRCPGGESYHQLHNRVMRWWDELTDSDQQLVIVITHSGVIKSILSAVLGMPFSNSNRLAIDWGHIAKIVFNNDEYLVKFVNR